MKIVMLMYLYLYKRYYSILVDNQIDRDNCSLPANSIDPCLWVIIYKFDLYYWYYKYH